MKVTAAVEQIEGNAYDCSILVHPAMQTLERARGQVLAIPTVCELYVGMKLSAALLETPAGDRGRAAQRWLAGEIDAAAPWPLLCTRIDLLFEPDFRIDPLALFRGAARRARLIILWPGDYSEGILSYAVPEHGHYRAWRLPADPDLLVVRLED